MMSIVKLTNWTSGKNMSNFTKYRHYSDAEIAQLLQYNDNELVQELCSRLTNKSDKILDIVNDLNLIQIDVSSHYDLALEPIKLELDNSIIKLVNCL